MLKNSVQFIRDYKIKHFFLQKVLETIYKLFFFYVTVFVFE